MYAISKCAFLLDFCLEIPFYKVRKIMEAEKDNFRAGDPQ